MVLNEDPPEQSCRPSVDVLFRSVAAAYGPAALAVVLTGMGRDGQAGCEAIRAAGGQVLAQDEATSVVWGMPGQVARAGLADRVLPLDELGAGDRPACARVDGPGGRGKGDRSVMPLSRADFDFVRDLVCTRSAIALTAEKGYLAEARLAPLARAEGFASIDELVDRLRADPRGGLAAEGGRGDGHQRDLVLPRRAPVRGPPQATSSPS